MTTTAKDLGDYYSALTQVIDDTVKLNELQTAVLGVPFIASDRAQFADTEQELQKRAEMARAVQGVVSAFSQLSGSNALADVSDAASKLGQDLVSIRALPTGSPVPDAISQAEKLVVQLIQEHKERDAAKAMDNTFAALADLYSEERSTYDSINRTYVILAKSLANALVDRDLVDRIGLAAPALQPFGLAPRISSTAPAEGFQELAKLQINEQAAAQITAHQKASTGMQQALLEMSKRIHLLATEKSMSSRGVPLSLADVEKWIAKPA